jgi:hypothetical protein
MNTQPQRERNLRVGILQVNNQLKYTYEMLQNSICEMNKLLLRQFQPP